MEFLTQLWLPILVSAILVWIASAIIWMGMPHRRSEWSALPDETGLVTTLRSMSIEAGFYSFPFCADRERMKDESVQQMIKEGPVGVIHVWRKWPNMGVNMAWSFVFYLVVGAFVAYLGWNAFEGRPAPTYLEVFQITGVAAFMAHSFALIPMGIWFGKPVKNMAFDVIDGLVYGLLTGGVFGWLWPAAQDAMDATGGVVPGA